MQPIRDSFEILENLVFRQIKDKINAISSKYLGDEFVVDDIKDQLRYSDVH